MDQGYPNLEYIIVDGASDDGSLEIIKRYSKDLDYWVSEPDGGQTDALIKGFAQASGDILGWLCSDDLFEPNALYEVAETFLSNPRWQVVYGDTTIIDEVGRPVSPKKEISFNRFIWLYNGNYIPQASTFWRHGVYERIGGLDPRWNLAMDADLWIRFSEVAELHHVSRVWSRQRLYPDQKTGRLRAECDEEGRLLHSRYISYTPAWRYHLKRFVARGTRVSLKLVRGAYW